jgi:hypothetical protein
MDEFDVTGSRFDESRLIEFVRLETAVWQALVDGDAAADEELLADDFLGVYPSGFSDRSDHLDQLADGPTVAAFAISQARLVTISEHAVMLCYRADSRRTPNTPHPEPEAMYVSSLWCRRGDRWVNVFSQDTPVDVG